MRSFVAEPDEVAHRNARDGELTNALFAYTDGWYSTYRIPETVDQGAGQKSLTAAR